MVKTVRQEEIVEYIASIETRKASIDKERISKKECFHKNKKKRSKQQKIMAEGLTFFHIRSK